MNKKNILYLFSFLYDKDPKIRILLFFSIFLSLLFIALNIITPILLKKIADQYITTDIKSFENTFFFLLMGYSIFWTITQVISPIRDICMYPVLERAIKSLNLTLMSHLNTLSHHFFTKTNIGSLISSFERIHTTYQEMVCGILFSVVSSLVTILIASGLIGYFYHFKYALLIIFLLIVFSLFSLISTAKAALLQRGSNKKYKEVVSYIVDKILNFELIKYFCNQEYEQKNLKQLLTERENSKVSALIYSEKIKILQWIIIGFFFISINYFISQDILTAELTIGDFFLINTYIIQFFTPLNNLGITFRNIKKGIVDLEDLINILNIKPEIDVNGNLINISFINNSEIEFKNVHFEYESKKQILNNISFRIPFKTSLAIIGPSGSGKTTITKLLFGLYKYQKGDILINGKSITEINLNSLQSIIGIVPQDSPIFNNTLKYNIGYGNPLASFEEIQEAAKKSNIHDFILSLPMQYETIVGPRGINLSGGERQRIAIARTLLKKPKILIFDEATSSLDKDNEIIIQNNIYSLAKEFTSIIITHRPSLAMYSNKIIILNQGNIAACGSHDDLLNFNNYYKLLWEKQKNNKKS